MFALRRSVSCIVPPLKVVMTKTKTSQSTMTIQSMRRLCSQPPATQRAKKPKSMLFKVGIALFSGATMFAGYCVMKGVITYQNMVSVLVIVLFFTEEEMDEMRRRSQENLAHKKKTMEPGARLTDKEVLVLPAEFMLNADRRRQTATPEELASVTARAEQEVQKYFRRTSPHTPDDIFTELRMWLGVLYTDEELRIIAHSPACTAAVEAGNFPTSAEVRKWSQLQ